MMEQFIYYTLKDLLWIRSVLQANWGWLVTIGIIYVVANRKELFGMGDYDEQQTKRQNTRQDSEHKSDRAA